VGGLWLRPNYGLSDCWGKTKKNDFTFWLIFGLSPNLWLRNSLGKRLMQKTEITQCRIKVATLLLSWKTPSLPENEIKNRNCSLIGQVHVENDPKWLCDKGPWPRFQQSRHRPFIPMWQITTKSASKQQKCTEPHVQPFPQCMLIGKCIVSKCTQHFTSVGQPEIRKVTKRHRITTHTHASLHFHLNNTQHKSRLKSN